MRLVRYMQQGRGLSRRKITAWIQEGLVFLNQVPVLSFATELEVGDILDFPGENSHIVVDMLQDSRILLFHKPIGFTSSKSDPHNKTIYDVLPEKYATWWYIGRLDKDSRGLILLTNNTRLVHAWSHPSFRVIKEYAVVLDRLVSDYDITSCLQGIRYEGDVYAAEKVEKVADGKKVIVSLYAGKNRHIRKMFAALGYEVLDLCRVREGDYIL